MPKKKWLSSAALLIVALALLSPGSAGADQARPDMAVVVGERSPAFSVVTSEGNLADYDRDYYGRHHLVLTFFPAAFTPV